MGLYDREYNLKFCLAHAEGNRFKKAQQNFAGITLSHALYSFPCNSFLLVSGNMF